MFLIEAGQRVFRPDAKMFLIKAGPEAAPEVGHKAVTKVG
jgi:hypothetical protein